MGLFDFIKGELIEVVHWEDESQDTMVYKFPIAEKQQIKYGAQLVVRPSQTAIFVYEGEIADVFGPGKYELKTDSIPVLTTLKNWKYGFESPFKTDVYFVNTKQFTNQKWGTSNPIMMRDAEFGMLRLRGYGVYAFRVNDPVLFLKEAFGSNKFYTVDKINEHLRSLIVSTASDAIAEAKIPAIDLAMNYDELGRLIQARIVERFEVFGLLMSDFAIENLSLPDSVEKAIDKRSEMGVLGDLNRYAQYQTAEAIRDAAQNEGGLAGMGAGMGAGFNIGNTMANAFNGGNSQAGQGNTGSQPAVEKKPCPHCGEMIKSDAKFCPECGQKTQRECVKCHAPIGANAKFCPECGASQVTTKACSKCGAQIKAEAKFCPECGEVQS